MVPMRSEHLGPVLHQALILVLEVLSGMVQGPARNLKPKNPKP